MLLCLILKTFSIYYTIQIKYISYYQHLGMLSTLPRVISYSFRIQKLNKQIDLEKIKAQRKTLMNQLPFSYTTSTREHEDLVYEQKLYGRKCYVIGMTPDSEQSATYFKSVFKSLSPGLVILGGFNNSKLFSLRLADSLEEKRAIRGYDNAIQPSKLFCKKLITPMLTRILHESKDYAIHEQHEVVYHIDHHNKHIQSSNYLTILNRSMFKQFTKLSFGLPSDYIIFEDIMIQQSIQNLRSVYSKILQRVKLNENKLGQSERTGRFYPDHVRQQMKFYAFNEPSLNNKQISYTTALLNKTVTSIDKVVLFVPRQHVNQIAQNVHKISIDPQQVYRAGFKTNIDEYIKSSSNSQTGIKLHKYLYNQNKSEAVDELIQKFVILNDLKDNALEIQLLENNQNVFTKMVFGSLFADFTVEDIISRYQKYKNQYNLKKGQVIQKRVLDVVHYIQPQKNFYTLTEMLKTQQQRIQDFPIKLQIDNKQIRRQNKRDLMEIYQQIKQITRNQLEPNQQFLINSYLSGKITKQNLILFQKLFVKAKIKLKKTNIKLPVHHYGAMSAVFKDQIKQYMVGGSQKIKLQNFKQSIEELKQTGLFKQITQQEFEKLSKYPRLSIQLDENGTGNIIPDGQTVEQFQKTAGEDVLKDFLEMENTLKDKSHHYQQYQEEDEGKQKKDAIKKNRKGRRI